MSKDQFVKGIDGRDIFLRIWDQVEKPLAMVQIFHGMAEHSLRYNDFALFLNKKGLIVYANDHRGHGYSQGEDVLGYTGQNGFNNIVEDGKLISDLMKKAYPSLPLFIFAHSFGSFVGQEYIIRYSKEINGIILSGSAKQDGLDVKGGRLLASLQNKIFDDKAEANLLDNLSFGSYNNRIEKRRTKFDFLSRDDKEVYKYILDDLSGYISPINFYYNLFSGFRGLYKQNRLAKISKGLPILILSGAMDPVGKYGASVKALYKNYQALNIDNVQLKLFEGCRHELVNEINKDEVYDFIWSWLENLLVL